MLESLLYYLQYQKQNQKLELSIYDTYTQYKVIPYKDNLSFIMADIPGIIEVPLKEKDLE